MEDFLLPDAARHLRSLVPAESPTMRAVAEDVAREGQPAVPAATGALLRVLVGASGGRRVLEIGTNLGYSALWMAGALAPGGMLDTIELDPGFVRRARARFAEAGLAERVRVHEGAALDVLPRMAPGYDLVFIDCVKEEYVQYLEHARRLARPGGLIVADNLLWSGRVWSGDRSAPTLGILAYTDAIRSDARLASTVLPVGDGVAVSVVLP